MNPFVQTIEELESFEKKHLIGHIMWLYSYIEEIKQQYRDNIGKEPNVI